MRGRRSGRPRYSHTVRPRVSLGRGAGGTKSPARMLHPQTFHMNMPARESALWVPGLVGGGHVSSRVRFGRAPTPLLLLQDAFSTFDHCGAPRPLSGVHLCPLGAPTLTVDEAYSRLLRTHAKKVLPLWSNVHSWRGPASRSPGGSQPPVSQWRESTPKRGAGVPHAGPPPPLWGAASRDPRPPPLPVGAPARSQCSERLLEAMEVSGVFSLGRGFFCPRGAASVAAGQRCRRSPRSVHRGAWSHRFTEKHADSACRTQMWRARDMWQPPRYQHFPKITPRQPFHRVLQG